MSRVPFRPNFVIATDKKNNKNKFHQLLNPELSLAGDNNNFSLWKDKRNKSVFCGHILHFIRFQTVRANI